MLKSHDKFHSANGKRLILVADDELINREILGHILQSEQEVSYEVIYAADGQETLDQIQQNKEDLSLVLLDLMMPVISGLEVLKRLKNDPQLLHIPVIVLTADQNAEIESLNQGALDYIPKPYPKEGIILARVRKAIELSEDRDIISATERDPLTGLFNREYFYRYAEQYDQHHRDKDMDAIVVDINHFHMINERFGTAYGDEVLRSIGERIREAVQDEDGIVCRREADTFMAYCLHREDYKEILEHASIGLIGDESVNSRIRLRLGVYANVDNNLDIERRFDRAKMAADTVKGSFTRTIGVYDNSMHERELYAEHLIDDFQKAINEKQFQVHFQPKFDIRPATAVLYSAEALVRWIHPTLGMISPGIFIPLFEENGLIQILDNYVWRETAAKIQEWKTAYDFSVPISVNVSRIDMYDPLLLQKFEAILKDFELDPEDLFLEITESAYTKDSGQIIETVNQLRDMGFRIEMDDFGTGYSSLNMISSMPIDALKLDMKFVHSAFQDQRDTRMLEVIIDIADHLNVPVIAEGVETEEQVVALKDLGCDIVQGYYYSKPVTPQVFEEFLKIRKEVPPEDLLPEIMEETEADIPEVSHIPTQPERQKQPIRLRAVNYIFAALAIIIAVLLGITNIMISTSYLKLEEAENRYTMAEHAAMNLESGSDYLTESVRTFAVTGDLEAMNNYFEEANVTRRRDLALEDLNELLKGDDSQALDSLSTALDYSNALMEREYHAMKLIQLAYGYEDEQIPEEVVGYELDPVELKMSREEQIAGAQSLVFDEIYISYKDQIRENVTKCTMHLINSSSQAVDAVRDEVSRLILIQTILLIILVLAVIGEVLFITLQVRIPLARMVESMRRQELIPPAGAAEMLFVSQTYNEILTENQKVNKQLSYEASHDMLTGIRNRTAYELFMETADKEHIALMIVDVDEFKKINDTYGHDVGDRILKRVAEILQQSFRSVDGVFRLGGDEFVVVMTRANSTMRQLAINKIAHANMQLQHSKDGLPKATLSVGIAFSDRKNPQGDIFKDADTALYKVKTSGRCGCAVYGDDMENESYKNL